jgi:hypothetical protein
MKLFSTSMVAVVMMVSALGAVGCSTGETQSGPVAPEENVAAAPVVDDQGSTASVSGHGVEKDWRAVHYYGPRPPAARLEVIGVAPSARHFWAPGYWRYNGREHVWIGGRWELRRDGFQYIAPHWQRDFRGRWEYLPGHWSRTRRFF